MIHVCCCMQMLLAGYFDGNLRLWDTRAGRVAREVMDLHQREIVSVAVGRAGGTHPSTNALMWPNMITGHMHTSSVFISCCLSQITPQGPEIFRGLHFSCLMQCEGDTLSGQQWPDGRTSPEGPHCFSTCLTLKASSSWKPSPPRLHPPPPLRGLHMCHRCFALHGFKADGALTDTAMLQLACKTYDSPWKQFLFTCLVSCPSDSCRLVLPHVSFEVHFVHCKVVAGKCGVLCRVLQICSKAGNNIHLYVRGHASGAMRATEFNGIGENRKF